MARYAVRPSLDPAAALRSLLRWMSGSEPVVGLPDAAIGTPRLEWLPVWFARTRGKGGERTHERRADDAAVLEARRRLIPPASMIRLTGDTHPFPGASDFPQPTVSAAAFRAELEGEEVLELALVHVPFYRFTYSFRGMAYTAAVDAARGEVRPGPFPKKAEWPFNLLAVATLLAYVLPGFSFTGVATGQPAPAAATLIAYAAILPLSAAVAWLVAKLF